MTLSPLFWCEQLLSEPITNFFKCLAKSDAIIFESLCHLFLRTSPDHQNSKMSSNPAIIQKGEQGVFRVFSFLSKLVNFFTKVNMSPTFFWSEQIIFIIWISREEMFPGLEIYKMPITPILQLTHPFLILR